MTTANRKSRYLYLVFLAAIVLVAFMWYRYRQPKYRAGEIAPDFTATLLDGRQAHLSDLRGHYVLLQFWGSWCGPCRAENPHIRTLYNTFHDDGFEVFSVALDRSERAWKNAIREDGLAWPYHTIEKGDFSGGLARQFNIKSIPATMLLDPEGRVLAVNQSPHQLHKMLGEVLAAH